MSERTPIGGDLERAFSWFGYELRVHVCFNRSKLHACFFQEQDRFQLP